QDHRAQLVGFDQRAQGAALAEHVRLADELVEGARTHAGRQRRAGPHRPLPLRREQVSHEELSLARAGRAGRAGALARPGARAEAGTQTISTASWPRTSLRIARHRRPRPPAPPRLTGRVMGQLVLQPSRSAARFSERPSTPDAGPAAQLTAGTLENGKA